MSFRDSLIALAVVALWGCNFAVAKFGLTEFPPLFLMVLRFSLVALLLVPFVAVPVGRLRQVFLLSVSLGGLHFPLIFSGLADLDAATASIAVQLEVPFASLLAALVFKDMLGWRRSAGMLVAFAGIAIIAGEPRLAGRLGPLALVVAASFAFAVASIQIKALGPINGFALNGWIALFAVPQLLVGSLLLESGQLAALAAADWRGWGAVLYMALISTIVAYGAWYFLVGRYPVNQTMPWLLTTPVFGVLAGVVILGEAVTPPLLLGGALTVAGVAVIVIRRPRTIVPPAANPG
ncbi:MAG: EamA family transporter [Azospirillum sp.]|nr:EamA family transporter [Azospirillum sp.]